MNAFLNDLRYAARQLASAPLFTGLAILSFGLGIGANTTLYTWAKSLLLDPFPAARHSSRLVAINGTDKNLSATSLSYLDYLDFRRRAKSVDGLIAIRPSSVALGNADKPVRIFIEMATANYFEILGVPLAHGRGFLESEDAKPLGAPVIVLSYELWQRQFGGDPRVIGQTVPVNTHAFTIRST